MAHIDYRADEDLGIISFSSTTPQDLEGDPPRPPTVQKVQFQNGPVGENGVNGIQNEDVLKLLAMRLRALNSKFPCRENSIAITKIEEAWLWLEHRTRIREEQGVEGKNENHVS